MTDFAIIGDSLSCLSGEPATLTTGKVRGTVAPVILCIPLIVYSTAAMANEGLDC